MSVNSLSIVVSEIVPQRHPGLKVAEALTKLADVPVVSAVDAGDHWSLLADSPMPPELVGLICYEMQVACSSLFRRSIVPNGYYVARQPEVAGKVSRIARELKLSMTQGGFMTEAAELNRLASTMDQLQGVLEGHANADVFQWDAKHWALAILGGLGVGTFVFGVCVSLGHDLYAITKPAVLHGGRALAKKIADLVKRNPPPPSAGAGGGNAPAFRGWDKSARGAAEEDPVGNALLALPLGLVSCISRAVPVVISSTNLLSRGAHAVHASFSLPRLAPVF